MTKAELVDGMAKEAGITKKAAAKALTAFVEAIQNSLKKKGGKIRRSWTWAPSWSFIGRPGPESILRLAKRLRSRQGMCRALERRSRSSRWYKKQSDE